MPIRKFRATIACCLLTLFFAFPFFIVAGSAKSFQKNKEDKTEQKGHVKKSDKKGSKKKKEKKTDSKVQNKEKSTEKKEAELKITGKAEEHKESKKKNAGETKPHEALHPTKTAIPKKVENKSNSEPISSDSLNTNTPSEKQKPVETHVVTTDAEGRTIHEGAFGSRYVINKNGKKFYLKKIK
jgi:hypothetical protein